MRTLEPLAPQERAPNPLKPLKPLERPTVVRAKWLSERTVKK